MRAWNSASSVSTTWCRPRPRRPSAGRRRAASAAKARARGLVSNIWIRSSSRSGWTANSARLERHLARIPSRRYRSPRRLGAVDCRADPSAGNAPDRRRRPRGWRREVTGIRAASRSSLGKHEDRRCSADAHEPSSIKLPAAFSVVCPTTHHPPSTGPPAMMLLMQAQAAIIIVGVYRMASVFSAGFVIGHGNV